MFLLILLLVVAMVIAVNYDGKKTVEVDNTYRKTTSVTKEPENLIDTSILENALFIEDTSVRFADLNRGGGFIRVSVFNYQGAGIIEHYNSFVSNQNVDLDEMKGLVEVLAGTSEKQEKLVAAKRLVDIFGSKITNSEDVVRYFSMVNVKCKKESGQCVLEVRYQNTIPVRSVEMYHSKILAHIKEKWPYLKIEEDMGDIDIHI